MLGPGSPGVHQAAYPPMALAYGGHAIPPGMGIHPPVPDGSHPADLAHPQGGNKSAKEDTSLSAVTQRFLALLLKAEGGELDLNQAASELGVMKRRMYDITNVMEGVGLIEKKTKNIVRWKTSDEGADVAALRNEVEDLARMEAEIDEHSLIMQNSLRALAEDEENCRLGYILHDDITGIPDFANETLIVVKAPTGTRLEVPDPDSEWETRQRKIYQMYLKSKNGPIDVLQLQHGGSARRVLDLEGVAVENAGGTVGAVGTYEAERSSQSHMMATPSHTLPAEYQQAYYTSAPSQQISHLAPHYGYAGARAGSAAPQFPLPTAVNSKQQPLLCGKPVTDPALQHKHQPSPRMAPYPTHHLQHDPANQLRSIQPRTPAGAGPTPTPQKVAISKLSGPTAASPVAALHRQASASYPYPYSSDGVKAGVPSTSLTPLAPKKDAWPRSLQYQEHFDQYSIKDMVSMVSEMAPAAGSFQTPPPPVILSMAESGSTTAANPFTHGKLSDAHPGSISPLHGGSLLDPDYAANYLFSLEDTEGVGDLYMP